MYMPCKTLARPAVRVLAATSWLSCSLTAGMPIAWAQLAPPALQGGTRTLAPITVTTQPVFVNNDVRFFMQQASWFPVALH
ncbi:hypothetical protein CR155_08010 [Pollutimonas nitritireducens]|uniref:Uncharacterized protein n=1 Tax=Pollutimonas nitritireducens TaxID=2045209 RepID=A0A2N4UGB9_9BURK|nr:hypothetical protein CR155_08010 [Pollutimonas nitritireducens]